MWPPWGRSSSGRLQHSNSSKNFSFSTFKDVQKLCKDEEQQPEPDQQPQQQQPKKPSIFHRVRVTTSVLRNWGSAPTTPTSTSTNSSNNNNHNTTTPLHSKLDSTTTRSTQPSPLQPKPESTTTIRTTYLAPIQPKLDSTTTLSALPSHLHPKHESPKSESPRPDSPSSIALAVAGAEKRIVVYTTSLRAVRKTFEDCRTVRSILRGFRVHVDERDLLMDAGFLEELQGILGQTEELSLPRVFIGGRYVGGAEEIRQLHETGELKKFVAGLQAAEPGVCEGCGGYRFVLCDQCDGSRKLFMEKGGFRTCMNCNENGLIKCPACSSELP